MNLSQDEVHLDGNSGMRLVSERMCGSKGTTVNSTRVPSVKMSYVPLQTSELEQTSQIA